MKYYKGKSDQRSNKKCKKWCHDSKINMVFLLEIPDLMKDLLMKNKQKKKHKDKKRKFHMGLLVKQNNKKQIAIKTLERKRFLCI